MKIYESKKIKTFELVLSLFPLIIGVLFNANGSKFIGFYFISIGILAIAWAIIKVKRGLLFVELDSDKIIIPFKRGLFSEKWEKVSLGWKDIIVANKRNGFPRNGYVPQFLYIILTNGDKLTLSIPSLTIELDSLVKLINENVSQYSKS